MVSVMYDTVRTVFVFVLYMQRCTTNGLYPDPPKTYFCYGLPYSLSRHALLKPTSPLCTPYSVVYLTYLLPVS